MNQHLPTHVEKFQPGLTMLEARGIGRRVLAGLVDTPALDIDLIIGSVCEISRLDLITNGQQQLSFEQSERIRELLLRRARGEPIAYLLSEKEFFGLNFKVTKDVLIPRPDTETLVETALLELQPVAAPLVVDVCTGSGCIAVAISVNKKQAKVIATDISNAALEVARENARNLGQNIEFRQGNLLESCEDLRGVDLVVSNPPYIPTSEMPGLMRDVHDFEPHLALVGEGDDGLGFHCKIAMQSLDILKPGGFLMMEIGVGQAEILAKKPFTGFSPVLFVKDYGGIPRIAKYVKVSGLDG